jgi:hypothetical protein
MIDDEGGIVGGKRISRGSRSTRRKPTQVPLCPPQIPHDPYPELEPGLPRWEELKLFFRMKRRVRLFCKAFFRRVYSTYLKAERYSGLGKY